MPILLLLLHNENKLEIIAVNPWLKPISLNV